MALVVAGVPSPGSKRRLILLMFQRVDGRFSESVGVCAGSFLLFYLATGFGMQHVLQAQSIRANVLRGQAWIRRFPLDASF